MPQGFSGIGGRNVLMIRIENAVKIYDEKVDSTKALDNVSLTINDGEFIAIMGSSGSGKSTLLNMIGCMDVLTTGNYYIDEVDMTKCSKHVMQKIRKEKIGFVFQHFALMDYYTAYENVELPLLAKNIRRKERKTIVLDNMKKLDIVSQKNKTPAKMSGGQQQRVALARALASGASIILADEPTGALDQKNGKAVLDILTQVNKEGKTVIIVTHDEEIARRTNRIIRICDGKIVSDEATFSSSAV